MLDTRYSALETQLAPVLATRPSAVLMLGVAARRRRICVETRAVNRVSRLFPDTEGSVARTLAFESDGPAQRRNRPPGKAALPPTRSAAPPHGLARPRRARGTRQGLEIDTERRAGAIARAPA